MHVAFMHLTSLFDVPSDKHYQMDIASDCSINQYIHNLPEGGITLQKLEEICGKKLESHQGAWYYYNELEKYCQKNSAAFQKIIEEMLANGHLSDHSLWPDDMSSAEGKLLENHIKSIIKNTIDQSKASGSIPGELKATLDRILQVKPPVYNWKRAFRRLLGNSYNISTKMTRRKESTRFEGNPGIKFKKKSSILIGIDTSGSVSEKELEDFFSEIYHVWKAGTRVHIIEWDTRITNEYDYNGHMPKYITGRGETDPNPSIEYYNNHIKDYQSFINFTDAYFYQHEYIKPKQTMYWVITSDGYQNLELPGIKINIPKL